MNVVGMIPARGGSKGLPGKNLAPLLGRPLLAWTAQESLAAARLKQVILSTDCSRIAEVGRTLGLAVPFLRPAKLAEDETPTLPVLQHAVRFLERQGELIDAVFILQPTNPLRTAADIDGAVARLQETGADSVVGYVPAGDWHPARMRRIDATGCVSMPAFAEEAEGTRRQERAPLYVRESGVHVVRRDVVMEHNCLRGKQQQAWIMPRERSCDIDDAFDLELAAFLLERRPAHARESIADGVKLAQCEHEALGTAGSAALCLQGDIELPDQ